MRTFTGTTKSGSSPARPFQAPTLAEQRTPSATEYAGRGAMGTTLAADAGASDPGPQDPPSPAASIAAPASADGLDREDIGRSVEQERCRAHAVADARPPAAGGRDLSDRLPRW